MLQNGSYVIYSAQNHHNGTYTCIATTIAGSKTAAATVFVIGNYICIGSVFYHQIPFEMSLIFLH